VNSSEKFEAYLALQKTLSLKIHRAWQVHLTGFRRSRHSGSNSHNADSEKIVDLAVQV
jgi:hypothetical protein